jgi:hypothetical protein
MFLAVLWQKFKFWHSLYPEPWDATLLEEPDEGFVFFVSPIDNLEKADQVLLIQHDEKLFMVSALMIR